MLWLDVFGCDKRSKLNAINRTVCACMCVCVWVGGWVDGCVGFLA